MEAFLETIAQTTVLELKQAKSIGDGCVLSVRQVVVVINTNWKTVGSCRHCDRAHVA